MKNNIILFLIYFSINIAANAQTEKDLLSLKKETELNEAKMYNAIRGEKYLETIPEVIRTNLRKLNLFIYFGGLLLISEK